MIKDIIERNGYWKLIKAPIVFIASNCKSR